MRQKRETPEPWKGAFERAGLASLRQVATRANLTPQTVVRLVHGEGVSHETVLAVTDLLAPADRREALAHLGTPHLVRRRLPDAAAELSDSQWQAVEAVIVAMTEPRVANIGSQSDDAQVMPMTARRRRPPTSKEAQKMAARRGRSDPEGQQPL